MSRYTLHKACAEQGCKEWSRFEYETRADYADGAKRNHNWRCVRHSNPERVLSLAETVKEHVLVSRRGALERLYWGGNSGFVFGPGFKAWADDFPEGTRLIVTARVELPPDAGADAPQAQSHGSTS